jgi:hypothetical protein
MENRELVVCRQGPNYRTRSITTEYPINVIKYTEVSQPEGQHITNSRVLTSATRQALDSSYLLYVI